jgi:hypothetical protein
MGLPLSIDYVAARDRTIVGDLILTRFAIYFFPHTDRSKKRGARRYAGAGALMLAESAFTATLEWTGFGAVALIPVLKEKFGGTTNRSRLKKAGLWKPEDSSSSLSTRLDEHLAQLLRQRRSPDEFSSTLPRPERFAVEDVDKLWVTWNGTLHIRQRYDTQRFRVGIRRRRTLVASLWEAGFPIVGLGR